MIRILLFLAALGVISQGMPIDDANPPASVFQNAAGVVGYKLFGVVMWAAAITSVVGAAFTSVSFFKNVSSGDRASKQYRNSRVHYRFDNDLSGSRTAGDGFGVGRHDQWIHFCRSGLLSC